jgi:hypothetical protein
MTNASQEPEEPRSQEVVRILLPREACTDPETAAAKVMHAELQKALKTLWWVRLDAFGYLPG